ncbi:MAG: orotate phosphoribosyltransferase [Candidatus Omnitrophota bacterium]|jgi:orotate phosphoribosyltransferase
MENEELKDLRERLFKLLEKDALRRGDFTLSSGKKSNYYLDGRVITLTPEGAYLIANIILKLCEGKGISAIGGPTLGADPILGALGAISHIKGIALKTFIVRKSAKEHGARRRIEGPQLIKGDKVLLVDDVATTGKALIEAKETLIKEGIDCSLAMVIVDRCEGARENLSQAGLELKSIFTIRDFGL